MKRILFVDDEPKVLEGLRRMLRCLRREWEMEFVDSGQAALARLDAVTFDVVVTDMRMPGMSGAELLHQVAARHPATVRIILSGQCDRETVIQAVGPAHQFLTKPCDSETLKRCVGRVCALRDRVTDDAYQRLASRVQGVACLPAAWRRLDEQSQAAEPSLPCIGAVIADDMGLSLKVLQLVNSGFFGTPQRVFDPRQAVEMLGPETLRSLAAAGGVFVPMPLTAIEEADFESLRRHSALTAQVAWHIAWAETHDRAVAQIARLSGWLHDIGYLVLAQERSERVVRALRRFHDAAPRGAGENWCAHADIGAYLVGLWGLPEEMLEPIALHHQPALSNDRQFTALTAVHVANALALDEDVAVPRLVDLDYLDRIGCGGRLEAWRADCRHTVCEEVLV